MNETLKPQFEQLRDWLRLAKDKAAIDRALRRFANAQGFEWFTYLSVHESDIHGMSNYPPPWQQHYLDSGLAKVDPVIEAIDPRRGAYTWSELGVPVRQKRCHREFFSEARVFGIRSGISIPIFNGFGRRALFTFSSSERKPDPTLIADQYSVLTIGAFIDGYLQNQDHETLMKSAPCPLTDSQLECLAWLSEGKGNADIAALRNVSERAVDYQLQSIRQKLNALTTSQAVSIAVRRRWI